MVTGQRQMSEDVSKSKYCCDLHHLTERWLCIKTHCEYVSGRRTKSNLISTYLLSVNGTNVVNLARNFNAADLGG